MAEETVRAKSASRDRWLKINALGLEGRDLGRRVASLAYVLETELAAMETGVTSEDRRAAASRALEILKWIAEDGKRAADVGAEIELISCRMVSGRRG